MMDVEICYGERPYRVKADMRLIAEIEGELGGIPALKKRFSGSGWTVTELALLTQMLLQAAGRTVDFIELGDAMLKDGLAGYLGAAREFLAGAPD